MKRYSWIPADTRSRTRWWLVHRLLPVLVVVGVAWLFGYLLLLPFLHPRIHLLFAAAPYSEAELRAAAPEEDLSLLRLPNLELLGDDKAAGLGVLASVAALDEQFDSLERLEIKTTDILLVWLRAQLVTVDGQIQLLCGDFDPADERSGRYPLERVLDRVRRSPARSKFVFLDAGRSAHHPRLGIFAECSPQQVRAMVQGTGDTTLWLFLSHSELQGAQDLADPPRSALAAHVAQGLRGDADRNSDQLVDLAELAEYVRTRLITDREARLQSQVSRHDNRPGEPRVDWRQQTPLVVWGGGAVTPATVYPLVAPVAPAELPKLDLPPGTPLPGRAGQAVKATQTAQAKLPAVKPKDQAAASTDAQAPPESATDETDAAGSQQPTGMSVSSNAAPAAELVDRAWSLYQSLEASNLQPRRRAPHLWRALAERLSNLEAACGPDDTVSDPASVEELRRIVLQLEDLAAGRTPPRVGRLDLVSDLGRWAGGTEPAFPAHSLAMEESLAAQRGRPLSAEVSEAVSRLDAVIAGETADELAKWIGELPPGLDVYSECRLARRLNSRQDLSWPVIREALRVARVGEQAAAASFGTGSWAWPEIERGDRLRLLGERSLLSGVRSGDASRADSLLARAASEYERAQAIQADVSAVQQSVETFLFQFPDWFHAAILSLAAPPDAAVDLAAADSLLDELTLAVDLLDQPSAARLPELRRVRSELERLLLASAPRNRRAAATGVTTRNESSAPASFDDQLRRLGRIAELYGRWLRMVAGHRFQDEPFPEILTASRRLAEADRGTDDFWAACRGLGENLRKFQRALPSQVNRLTRQNTDLSDPATRSEQIVRLREAQRMLYLIHPWDVGQLTSPGPAELLRRAERYDFLVWQQRRLEAAIQDATADQRRELADAADAYHRAAAAIALQPPLPEPVRPRLLLAGPDRIELIDSPEQEVQLAVTNRHSRPQDAWLFCDYDPQMLEVQTGQDGLLYDQSADIALALQAVGEDSAGRPSAAGRQPSLRLRTSETGNLRLKVRRRNASGQAARIVFRAVCDAGVSRHDLVVGLPASPDLDLRVEGLRDAWRWTESDLTLYPFPNQSTSYQLYLVNPGNKARLIDFRLLPAPRARLAAPPPGEVAADVGSDYLARVEAAEAVLAQPRVVVDAGAARVPLVLLPPVPEDGAKPPAGAEAPEPTALPSVLLAVATDTVTGRMTIRRIEIMVQRPSRYVEPRVQYDPQVGRVEIVVRPAATLPPGGVSIVALPPPSADGEVRGRATALLNPGMAETRLQLDVPPDADAVFPFTIDVDDFARAFRYEIPARAAARTAVSASREVRVRIVEPVANKSFGPKPEPIDMSLEVDIPYALLHDGSTTLEVGVDVDRDRTFLGEESLRVTSDRLVDLFLDPAVADGRLGIETRVSDLVVTLPPPKIRASRANLLARAVLPEQDVWSQPVEVVFDDEPPQISQVQLVPGRSVAQGEVLGISLLASDGDLSGVALVEAAFDLDRRGEFTPQTVPVPGALQADGRWQIALPTAPVSPGVYNVLIQAADRVGNRSGYQRTRVEVVSKDAAKPPTTNQVAGRVVFGRLAKTAASGIAVRLVANEKLVMERRTDQDGQFLFEKVAPGDYVLEAEGLIAGNRRTGGTDLKVPPPPEPVPPVELVLQTER
ncbi:MAG: hypothetical protein KJ000_16175 [Pirellulaceae bacterium]|nr:hypothetical protein [Pirellulaceae bacterium]